MTLSLTSVGLGIIVLGAGLGIGILAHGAMGAMGRQPEMSSKIQSAMLIAAALIEGLALFAIVLVLLKG